jgi:phosphoesterase RecJ-like protein
MRPLRPASTDSARAATLRLLRSRQRFVLSGHVRPDGDCIGAEVALARVLASMGKQVRIVNPDPAGRRFEHLTGELELESWHPGRAPACDVAVFLDFAAPERSGGLAEALIESGAETLVVDHHLHAGEPWWDAAWIDPTAAATGLIVHRIAAELEVELDAVAAHGVFTSLVADTGWFRYSNTDEEVLRVAADMVARGVDVARVYGALQQRQPAEHPLATGRLLTGTRYHFGGRLAVATLPFDPGRAEEPDVDDALDVLRSVESVEVVLVLRETEEGTCRLSARSKGDFDVDALARRFGGGGHRRASGATLDGPLEDAARRLTAAAEEALGAAIGREARA